MRTLGRPMVQALATQALGGAKGEPGVAVARVAREAVTQVVTQLEIQAVVVVVTQVEVQTVVIALATQAMA